MHMFKWKVRVLSFPRRLFEGTLPGCSIVLWKEIGEIRAEAGQPLWMLYQEPYTDEAVNRTKHSYSCLYATIAARKYDLNEV